MLVRSFSNMYLTFFLLPFPLYMSYRKLGEKIQLVSKWSAYIGCPLKRIGASDWRERLQKSRKVLFRGSVNSERWILSNIKQKNCTIFNKGVSFFFLQKYLYKHSIIFHWDEIVFLIFVMLISKRGILKIYASSKDASSRNL